MRIETIDSRGRARRRASSRSNPKHTYQNLHRLIAVTNSNVRGNLFVTADTERTNGVSSLREDRLLTGELFQHLFSAYTIGASVAGFTVGAPSRAHPRHPFASASKYTHLGRLGETIPALPNANIEHELMDADRPHRVLSRVRLSCAISQVSPVQRMRRRFPSHPPRSDAR